MDALTSRMNLRLTAPNTYTISGYDDWAVGIALFGGLIAAQIHHAASTHMATDATLKPLNQADIMTMHVQFLRQCVVQESTIVITVLKSGKTACNLQLQLFQDGVLKVFALATTTNFDRVLGPSVPSVRNLHPTPFPKPNFSRIDAGQADGHWLPASLGGDFLPGIFGELRQCRTRCDYEDADAGCSDQWVSFKRGARVDATRLALLGDFIPAMSATYLQTGLPGDDTARVREVREWWEKNPGRPAVVEAWVKEIVKRKEMEQTMSLSYEFKRRLPTDGLRWVYSRVHAGIMEKGRLDVNVSILDEDDQLLMTCRHNVLVLDIGRKFVIPKASL